MISTVLQQLHLSTENSRRDGIFIVSAGGDAVITEYGNLRFGHDIGSRIHIQLTAFYFGSLGFILLGRIAAGSKKNTNQYR